MGLASAIALADAGCRVTVADPGPPFGGASGVAAGMLAPAFEATLDPEVRGHFDLLLAARDLWPAMQSRAGVSIDRSGALAVGSEAWLAAASAEMTRLGLHLAELPHAAVQALAPGLSARQALMTREDWRLEPRHALVSLRAAAVAAGVSFQSEEVRSLDPSDWLVVATGAGRVLSELAPELARLTPVKGHIVRVAPADVGRVTVRGEGAYAVPAEGGVSVGATMEVGVSDPRPDPTRAGQLLASGASLFPSLVGAPHELFAGIRAATPDGLPMVGPGSHPKVVLAVGARRNGWLLAPLVARIVTACVMERDAGAYAAPLAPARFGGVA